MEGTLQPASTIPDDSLREYLRFQGMSPEIIEWKYFDAAFNRNRERGFVWWYDDQVLAFEGLVPFLLGRGSQSWESMWLCDWARRPGDIGRGMGLKLQMAAVQAFDHLFGVSGTDVARGLHAKVADRLVPDAGIVFRLPLRLGPILDKLGRRVPFLRSDRLRRLGRIPLPGAVRKALQRDVRTETGIPRAIGSLVESDRASGWYPRYDLDYLDWQLVRCPVLTCGTCYVPTGTGARAAAVFWRSITSTDSWRVAVWGREGAGDDMAAVLDGAIRQAYCAGGTMVRLIASRRDTDLVSLLESRRFTTSHHRLPLSIYTARPTSQPVDEIAGLSYLDGDFAYRF